MPKKYNSLQGFLRNEVLKNRIRPPSPPPPSERSTPLVSSEDIPASDADSLFGESICIPDKEHPDKKEQLLSSQLKQLLSQPTCTTAPPRAPTLVKPALQDLREDLKSLVYAEEKAGSREKNLVRRQRVALLNEIGWVEAEERRVREEEWKARFEEQRKTLPEPLSQWEKKRLGWAKARLEKERSRLEKTPKRQREEDLDDLDGEERHRLGVNTKRKAPCLTGHWNSTIHDYFPGLGRESEDGQGREALTLREVDPEERALLRRELAEMGERLAREERRRQRRAIFNNEGF